MFQAKAFFLTYYTIELEAETQFRCFLKSTLKSDTDINAYGYILGRDLQ